MIKLLVVASLLCYYLAHADNQCYKASETSIDLLFLFDTSSDMCLQIPQFMETVQKQEQQLVGLKLPTIESYASVRVAIGAFGTNTMLMTSFKAFGQIQWSTVSSQLQGVCGGNMAPLTALKAFASNDAAIQKKCQDGECALNWSNSKKMIVLVTGNSEDNQDTSSNEALASTLTSAQIGVLALLDRSKPSVVSYGDPSLSYYVSSSESIYVDKQKTINSLKNAGQGNSLQSLILSKNGFMVSMDFQDVLKGASVISNGFMASVLALCAESQCEITDTLSYRSFNVYVNGASRNGSPNPVSQNGQQFINIQGSIRVVGSGGPVGLNGQSGQTVGSGSTGSPAVPQAIDQTNIGSERNPNNNGVNGNTPQNPGSAGSPGSQGSELTPVAPNPSANTNAQQPPVSESNGSSDRSNSGPAPPLLDPADGFLKNGTNGDEDASNKDNYAAKNSNNSAEQRNKINLAVGLTCSLLAVGVIAALVYKHKKKGTAGFDEETGGPDEELASVPRRNVFATDTWRSNVVSMMTVEPVASYSDSPAPKARVVTWAESDAGGSRNTLATTNLERPRSKVASWFSWVGNAAATGLGLQTVSKAEGKIPSSNVPDNDSIRSNRTPKFSRNSRAGAVTALFPSDNASAYRTSIASNCSDDSLDVSMTH